MRKTLFIATTVAMLITSSGMVSAATLSELQEQLKLLTAQIATLQTQPTTSVSQNNIGVCPKLTRNLFRGMRGDDVQQLQQFLISKNLLTPDSATGFFGAMTETAVKKMQCNQNVICSGTAATTGYGAVGPKTRGLIAMLCTSGTTQTSSAPSPQNNAPPISMNTNPLPTNPVPTTGNTSTPPASSCPMPVKVYSDSNSADYPRMIELSDGRIFVGFSGTANGQTNILGFTSNDKGAHWQMHSVVAQNAAKSFFAPSFYETAPGSILGAYYEKCSGSFCNIAIKDALYSGNGWQVLGTIQSGGLDWGDGVYEPFFFKKDANTLQLYYADETTTKIGGSVKGQNVVLEERNVNSLSGDWTGSASTVAKGDTKGTQYGDRYGVPAVARMNNGNLIAVFESTLGVANGDYGLGYSTSNNNGASWTNPVPLLNPPTGKRNAGGPSIARLTDGTLVVTFSDSESNNTSLTNARMRFIYSTDNGTTWYTNSGRGYSLFDDYALYGSILQLSDGKIIVAKGGQTDWVPGSDNSIYVKTYADKNQFLSCTGAPGSSSATLPPAPPVQITLPPAPSSQSYSCAPSGTSVTFTWPSVSVANSYRPFIKNVGSCPAGWSADTNAPGTCYQTNITGTSATFTGIAGGTGDRHR